MDVHREGNAEAKPVFRSRVRVGTASWAIPASSAAGFGPGASVLERYASRFDAVEINSSFYRLHQPRTYARWAGSVPPHFRFAVKIPKDITHERRLKDCEAALGVFLDGVGMLGNKLGPLLIQLPPSLSFDQAQAEAFLASLRRSFKGDTVCEPRHRSWFQPAADQLLTTMRVARVAADPAILPEAGVPGGWRGLTYHRLHGSPRIYSSAYPEDVLENLRNRLAHETSTPSWCIFDNTALGAATHDAIKLMRGLEP